MKNSILESKGDRYLDTKNTYGFANLLATYTYFESYYGRIVAFWEKTKGLFSVLFQL